MAVIANNESIVPFFGERMTFIRGLDPLGLQNASDATFIFLLPGLNNVTGRLRYYSFYCWLLDAYSKKIGSTNPKDQRVFIRRAEYIIALLSQFINEGGSIPGSNYAKIAVNDTGHWNHDLQDATYKSDGTTRDTYWNYPMGAFGQYYLGSLRDIGIVLERDKDNGVYVRTQNRKGGSISGEELGAAYAENVGEENQNLFLECINKGEINESQLKRLLESFDPTLIPKGSDEQILLREMLLQKDFPLRAEEKPKTMRRQTIKHLLTFLSNYKEGSFNDRVFIYNCYSLQGRYKTEFDECITGWYYYQYNEYWQYGCTSILNGTLSYLEEQAGPNWMPLNSLAKEVTQEIVNEYERLGLIASANDTISTLLESLGKDPDEYFYFERTLNTRMLDKTKNAFLLIFAIYIKNRLENGNLRAFVETNDLARDGEISGFFYYQFEAQKNKTVSDFIYDFIFSNIIYRHQYVAFRKIGGGSLTTQKFIIEDQHIRYIGNFEPSYTGPRIARLVGFLRDLDIITAEHSLTQDGKLILQELISDNDKKA